MPSHLKHANHVHVGVDTYYITSFRTQDRLGHFPMLWGYQSIIHQCTVHVGQARDKKIKQPMHSLGSDMQDVSHSVAIYIYISTLNFRKSRINNFISSPEGKNLK